MLLLPHLRRGANLRRRPPEGLPHAAQATTTSSTAACETRGAATVASALPTGRSAGHLPEASLVIALPAGIVRLATLTRHEGPPSRHDADQSLARQHPHRPGDCGPAYPVVGGQAAHGRQWVIRRPLPGLDAAAQVGGDGLRWPLWSAWHTWIMPARSGAARPVCIESASSAVLYCLLAAPGGARTP